MLYFKSCLRCKDGTVELGSDSFGSFLSCITCGYTINSRSIRANGSIEQPNNLEEDVVMAPQLEPVATISEVDELEIDDLDMHEDDVDEIEALAEEVVELERAAI